MSLVWPDEVTTIRPTIETPKERPADRQATGTLLTKNGGRRRRRTLKQEVILKNISKVSVSQDKLFVHGTLTGSSMYAVVNDNQKVIISAMKLNQSTEPVPVTLELTGETELLLAFVNEILTQTEEEGQELSLNRLTDEPYNLKLAQVQVDWEKIPTH
ncbi:hypothetical protein [Brevibacillus dissolubilis]|uniref:hypothetical protein n=1 Tax=Brevibacillus dissolubilis TaxID=1844116 RepID=UPI0011165E64|nr:hypothetical protein [Brevibacillus dissolubilis]